MSRLRVRPNGDKGRVLEVTPKSAGWRHVGFTLDRLATGGTSKGNTGDREICLVLIAGKGHLTIDGKDYGEIGERMSPFDGAPWAAYVPPDSSYQLIATTPLDLGICSAPGGQGYAAKLLPPGTHPQMVRGKGANTRYVTNIMPDNDGSAYQLLVVEVITPGGNTSSYPPHKHDTDNLPNESYLEETYYHRFNPPQGYGFQRVYNDDRTLDEVAVIEDGDVMMAPSGYHPVATIHGYDSYYLNVMAGPKRIWKFHNEPAHEWLFTGLGAPAGQR